MAIATEPSLVVLAWGNESRGDDGVGPLLARRIEALENPAISVIEDLQLHIEHVTDLKSDVPVLFVDASVAIDSGFQLQRLDALDDKSVSTHTVSPAALLFLFEQTYRATPPEAYLLHVAATRFELGEPISAATAAYVEDAWEFLRGMLGSAPSEWRALLQKRAVTPSGRDTAVR